MGIGGVSMSALAEYLFDCGVSVRGTDQCESERTEYLRRLGIPVEIGDGNPHSERTIVYSEAVRARLDFTRLERAGKRLFSRAELLGKIASGFPTVVSVAGCHGKTTTTAMIAHLMAAAGKKFTSHIGGDDLDFRNYHNAGGDIFVTEACEYRRSFLSLKSSVAVILNVDKDHTDCYKNEEEIFEAFSAFARNGKRVIVNEGDKRARRIPHAVGFGEGGDYEAKEVRSVGETYSFIACERGVPLAEIALNVVGKIEVQNALAAIAAARSLGLSREEIEAGFRSFRGVKRRFERVGTFRGVSVIADYAHHPREIAASIAAARGITKGTLHVVFQPHTYTRTRDLMEEFVSVLGQTENPIIYETYPAREEYLFEGSAARLVSRIGEGIYVNSPQTLARRLEETELKKGDLILALGAGNIYEITKSILD